MRLLTVLVIYTRFEKANLEIAAAKMKHLTRAEAEGFYAEHKERSFFNELVKFTLTELFNG